MRERVAHLTERFVISGGFRHDSDYSAHRVVAAPKPAVP
jgi:hypothetical protein